MATASPGAGTSEDALWALLAEGEPSARTRLFESHASFARNIARRFLRERSYGDLELEDLHQVAATGLLEAIDRFDPQRRVPFRAYAGHRIAGALRDGIARATEVRRQQAERTRLRRERIRSLTPDDIGGLSCAEAIESLAEIAMGLALGFMLEGTTLYDAQDPAGTVSSPVTAYDSAAWHELVESLLREIDALNIREQTILRRHYLDGVGFDTLAATLGVTKGRISQLHKAALATLRKRLARGGHFNLRE